MRLNSSLLQKLDSKGFIKNCSNIERLDEILSSGQKIAVYCGFDPTAVSLHVGHLVSLTLLRHFAAEGHKIIPVLGTGTALVGDPSGRSAARPFLNQLQMELNSQGVQESIGCGLNERLFDLRMNNDWLSDLNMLDFLREIGSNVSISRMLSLDSVSSRLKEDGNGLSFLEFTYSLMQGFDFLHLSKEFPVLVQIGGSDQWGNICMGLDMISKSNNLTNGHKEAFALTHPLLTKSNGEKMGKSAGNAVWLNKDLLSDFDFYQFWRTMDDNDIPLLVNLLSERSDVLDSNVEQTKENLAWELTARIRGHQAADNAMQASRSRGANTLGLEKNIVQTEDLTDLAELMVRTKLCTSKSQARRLAEQGSLRVNQVVHKDMFLTPDDFTNNLATLSAGRTKHAALYLETNTYDIKLF